MKSWQMYLIAGLFLAIFSSFENSEAAPSPVSLVSGISNSEIIIVGEQLSITLEIDSSDTRFRKMDVFMVANWPSGTEWPHYFLDTNGDQLPNNVITLNKADMVTVNLLILCDGVCNDGDNISLQIFAQTDPRWYSSDYDDDPGNHTDTCGSDDCISETSPASASSNFTNQINIELAAYNGYSQSVVIDGFVRSGSMACEGDSTIGENLVPHDSSFIIWNFTLNNTGYFDDFYVINWTLYSDNEEVDIFSLTSLQSYPLLNGISTPGNNSFSDQVNFSITNASLGDYTILIGFNSGTTYNPASCIMDFQIVEVEPTGWEGTGYNCSFTNTTFCNETRAYCAEGVTNEDGVTCASMIDVYCAGSGKADLGCESWSSSKDINDCYAVTGREIDDPFTKGYCDEFFADQESISEELSITLSRNMIITLVITVIVILSIYIMSRKESKT